jgi:pectin methylesterase-like acyl-CoA thioesterase
MKKQLLKSLLPMAMMLLAGPLHAAVSYQGVTATWPFDAGADNATAATVSQSGVFSVTDGSLGSDLKYNGTQKAGSVTESQIMPLTSNVMTPNADDALSFRLIPKKGLTLTPKSISFCASRLGTNAGAFDVAVVSGTDTVMLAKDVQPQLVKTDPYYSSYSYNIDTIPATGEGFTLLIYLKKLANNKAYGFGNVVITGDISGTIEEVKTYKLSTSLSDAAAGAIKVSPPGTEFDEGTSVKLSVTENFGYHFTGWKDKTGNTVSTENPFTFVITTDTTLQATFTKNNVYALKLALTNGARSNLVNVTPQGNVVDGVHYYEEGTDVKLSAVSNKILTFTNWEDNSTTVERDITMDGEKSITANYSACDYIVGWDLYNESPASQRSADYASDTENTGMLSLRNAAGTTSSWLALGGTKGQQNGKYCARIWKLLSDKYYFEASFSTKGYENVKVAAAIGDDYNAYSTNNMEYSTDGVTYVKAGSYSLPNRGWDSEEFALPADASNQERVYVRFMPDETSALTGVASTNDGTSIADLFVTANSMADQDLIPPVLVSSLPANNSVNVSANGSVILTFNEKVKAGTGSAVMNGETVNAVFSGKTVIFNYFGLKYHTQYTLTIPSGMILDRSGNAFAGCDVAFTTMERVQPSPRLYDAVVATDGTGDYTTLQDAIDAVPSNGTKPYLVFVKAGTYKGHIDIPDTKTYLHIIGQGRDKVFISDDKLCGGTNAYPVDKGATLVDHAANGYFEGVSFVNSYGVEKNDGPQALALYTINDRVILNKCGLYSYQDTYLTTTHTNYRHYLKDCFIEGAVDFIYGQGNVFFDDCKLNIVRKSGGYIVAPNHAPSTTWGYVFMNTTITAPGVPSETSVWLGRPWHDAPKTVYINTRAEVTIPAAGWFNHMGGIPSIWADYNTMDANGNPVDLSQRNNYYYYTDDNGNKVEGYAKNRLTDEEAATYTIKNVLSGDDAWQPTVVTEECDKPAVSISADKMTWAAVPYAICYVITKDDKVIGFTTDTSYDYDANSSYSVQAVSEYGGLSDAASPATTQIRNIAGGKQLNAIYSVDGSRRNTLQQGINIVQYLDENGHASVKKVCK